MSSSMLRFLCIYLLLNFVSSSLAQNRRRQDYQIEWNSSNSFFRSKSAVLNVRLGDTIDFLCPSSNQSSTPEYNTVYLVSEIDYNLCFTENYQPLIRCDQPHSVERLMFTLSISKYLPYPNMPEFRDGHSYYFISTSSGSKSGVNQTFDGLCRTRNLRLIVDVQKYYRRYSKIDYSQYRVKALKSLSIQTSRSWTSSSSRRLSTSLTYLVIYSFLYVCLLL